MYRKWTKKQKNAQNTPHPDAQTTSSKKPQKKEKAESSSVVPYQPEKCLGRLKKDVEPIIGLYRELRNPHEKPRKTFLE